MKKYFVGYLALLVMVFVSLAGVSYADRAIRPVDQNFNVQTHDTTSSCLPAKIVAVAKSQIGMTFKNNKTPYGNSTYPFCAYFAVWAYKQAGCTPLPTNFEGGSRELLEWFAAPGNSTKHIVFKDISSALSGDIIVWKRTTRDGGHTGIVWYNDPANKRIWLIEANIHDDVRSNLYAYDDIPTRGGMSMQLYGFGRW